MNARIGLYARYLTYKHTQVHYLLWTRYVISISLVVYVIGPTLP
jgi:hypothetical protein